jgi:hypothetical protein
MPAVGKKPNQLPGGRTEHPIASGKAGLDAADDHQNLNIET